MDIHSPDVMITINSIIRNTSVIWMEVSKYIRLVNINKIQQKVYIETSIHSSLEIKTFSVNVLLSSHTEPMIELTRRSLLYISNLMIKNWK